MDGIQWDMFPNSGKVNFHGYNNYDHDNIKIKKKNNSSESWHLHNR